MIFDTHAHYDDEAFDGDREELLSGLAAGGIGTVVNVGADMESTKTTIALTEKYPFVRMDYYGFRDDWKGRL